VSGDLESCTNIILDSGFDDCQKVPNIFFVLPFVPACASKSQCTPC